MIPPPRQVTVTAKGRQYPKWRVAWTQAGKRYQKDFTLETDAKRFHRQKTADLMAGNQIYSQVTPADIREYLDAKTLLNGESVYLAIRELVELREKSGVPLSVAVDQANAVLRPVKGVPISQSIQEYLESKASLELSKRHLQDLRSRLGMFSASFSVDTDFITSDEISAWIQAQGSPLNRINHVRVLKGWITWCIRKGYFHEKWPVDSLPKIRKPLAQVEIYTPQEMRDIIAQAKPGEMPAIVFGGFCGLRTSEISRLKWSDVGDYVRVDTHKGRTKSRRLVPVPENARKWIESNRGAGRVTNTIQYKRRSWDSKPNALRHSWITYRVTLEKDVAKVAMEAGNSPQVIHAHYLELVRREVGEEWFRISLGIQPD